MAKLSSLFTWNDKAQRYTKGGRFISGHEVKTGLVRFIRSEQEALKLLSGQVASGALTIREWQLKVAQKVKDIQIAVQAIARGGIAQLTQSDLGKIGARLKFQYARLREFALSIERRAMTTNGILNRADLYALSSAGTYENIRREEALKVFTEERRVLAAAEHCIDCLEEAEKEWQPAGTLRPIGDSQCLMRCLCQFEYRNPVE